MKTISVLGSTGSIGRQTLDVCRWFPEELTVAALAAGSNVELLAEQAHEFKPLMVALADFRKYQELQQALAGLPTRIVVGSEALSLAASLPETDTVVAAVAGVAGLQSTLAAVEAGKEIAFANKEVLVAAGELMLPHCRQTGTRLIPVDSEHSALYQCLLGEPAPQKLILTASGGPFRTLSAAQLEQVTAAQALQHPTWTMGAKVTIDSASLANKGLEVIEAHYLFGMDYDDIEVVIHPQSIVHSMVHFPDGSVKAQLAPPDMRLPIQYALLGPTRFANPVPPLDLTAVPPLEFSKPDLDRFPALALAYQAGRQGGSYPCAFNAANEVLGAAFLLSAIPFPAIGRELERALERHKEQKLNSLEDILAVDSEVKRQVKEALNLPDSVVRAQKPVFFDQTQYDAADLPEITFNRDDLRES